MLHHQILRRIIFLIRRFRFLSPLRLPFQRQAREERRRATRVDGQISRYFVFVLCARNLDSQGISSRRRIVVASTKGKRNYSHIPSTRTCGFPCAFLARARAARTYSFIPRDCGKRRRAGMGVIISTLRAEPLPSRWSIRAWLVVYFARYFANAPGLIL